jgi:hypothetical protein
MTADTPEAADYQETLGRAYLQEGIEKTGGLEGGLKYYHGGPDKRQWGPKTNNYAQAIMTGLGGAQPETSGDLSKVSDADLMAMYQAASAAPEKPVQAPARAPAPAPARLPQKAPAAAPGTPANPTIAQDALSGFLQPFKDLGHTVMEGYRSTEGGKPLDPLFIPKLAGSLAGMTGAPVQAAVRPAARAINRSLPAPSEFTWNPKAPFRKLQGDDAQRFVEGQINTALSAAQPAGARQAPRASAPKAMTLDELQAAKQTAYKAVEQSGVQYTPKGFDDLAQDIAQKTASARINPLRHPKAASMVAEIQDMAAQGYAPTPTELDQLRQVVRRDVANPKIDDGDRFFGDMIIDAIDDFMGSAKGPQVAAGNAGDAEALLKTARDLNTRYRKVEAVTNARESAIQRAGTTGSGGNVQNATAQNIRRFTDPTSSKRIRNLTPAERKLAEEIVKPTRGQNALRLIGKLSPSGNGLMAALNVGATMTNPAMGAVGLTGILAKAAAEGSQAKKIDQLIKLMSMGGGAAAPKPPIPILTMAGKPALPILSPAGIVGASEVAARLPREPSARPNGKASTKAKGKLPQKR